ncbi:MAG: hypothetical protein KIS76_01295 [Pyrinomonadaceae bacterium]|nr:hypothetical protein [Pyrinomonadaceae bacterium]
MSYRIFMGIILISFLFISATIANSQILAWEMDGNAGNEISVASTTIDANLESSSIARGAGIDPSALANSYSSTNFAATTLATAISSNEYLQITVKPKSAFKVSLSSLDANFRRSSTGPTDFQWQYSLDGFSTAGINVGSAINFTNTNNNGVSQAQIDLSSVVALQNVAFPNTITFRLYGWNASATGGTFAIGRLQGNDLAIGGTTAAVTTSANGIISGKIKNQKGQGLRFCTVMLSGGSLPEPLYSTTNMFGQYRFDDIPLGEGYILQVFSRRYSFEEPSRFINLNQSISDADFTGDEQ